MPTPPLPNCFNILNLDYFINVKAQVSKSATLQELQDIVNKVFADISLLESTIQSQIDKLTKLNVLLTIPGIDPTQIVTWITNFVNDFLTPIIQPLVNFEAQLAALAAQVAELISSIEAAAARLGVTITIPTITISCTL